MSLLNASELTDPGKDVITIQMNRVATTAESLKIGNQQKAQNLDLGKLCIIPNAAGNQKQPVFTQIIVPIWIPLQRNHSAPHGSLKKHNPQKKWNPPALPLEAIP
jgi:hypothetical protein